MHSFSQDSMTLTHSLEVYYRKGLVATEKLLGAAPVKSCYKMYSKILKSWVCSTYGAKLGLEEAPPYYRYIRYNGALGGRRPGLTETCHGFHHLNR